MVGRPRQVGRRSKGQFRWTGPLLAAGVLVALVIAEAGLWLAGVESLSQRKSTEPARPMLARPKTIVDDANLGWALCPGVEATIEGVRYRINSLGFRGAGISKRKPDNTFRVMCLGDSVTYGVMVAQDKTYPAVLEELLTERLSGQRVEVINAGVPGYSSLQVLRFLKERGLGLRPDVVTLCVGVNDAFPIPAFEKSDSEQFGRRSELVRKASEYLGRSRVLTLLHDALVRAFPSRAKTGRPGTGPPAKTRATPQQYEENLRAIAKTCVERDIALIMFAFSIPEEHSRLMRRVAKETGAVFLDLEPVFARASGSGIGPGQAEPGPKPASDKLRPHTTGPVAARFAGVYEGMFSADMLRLRSDSSLFLDPCHPTARGHRLIAETLAKAILGVAKARM